MATKLNPQKAVSLLTPYTFSLPLFPSANSIHAKKVRNAKPALHIYRAYGERAVQILYARYVEERTHIPVLSHKEDQDQ